MNLITSRDNPLVKELRRLAQDSTAYRKSKRVWLEGDHLCRAARFEWFDVQGGFYRAGDPRIFWRFFHRADFGVAATSSGAKVS